MTDAPSTPAHRSFPVVLLRRTVIALALVVLILLPSVILFVITRQPSATYASLGALIGIMAVAGGSVRIGVITSIVVGLLAPVTIVAGLSPVTGAAVMALMTLTVGRLATFGLHRAVMLVPILLAWPMLTPVPWLSSELRTKVQELLTAKHLTVTEAVARAQAGSGTPSAASKATAAKVADAMVQLRMDSHYLGWVALFMCAGSFAAVLVTGLALRKVSLPAPVPHPRVETVPYTATITVLATAATYYCLEHPKLVAGSFLIATILVLTQVGDEIKWKLTVQRVLGTLGGILLLSALVKLLGTVTYTSVLGVPLPVKIYVVGAVAATLAVIAKFSPRQWIYYVLIAPGAAMLNAFTSAQATNFGTQRLVDNLVGAALVIVAAGITLVGTRLMGSRSDQTGQTAQPSPA